MVFNHAADLCVAGIAPPAGTAGSHDVLDARRSVKRHRVGHLRLLDLEAVADHPVGGSQIRHGIHEDLRIRQRQKVNLGLSLNKY